ncbi:transposase [Cellulosimicrobium funkei]|nr:transposase [Cellulosimicrobium funkei]
MVFPIIVSSHPCGSLGGIHTGVPQKSHEFRTQAKRGTVGGRSAPFDQDIFKGPNVVEGHFAHGMQSRGLAARCNRLAFTFGATALLCAVLA